jgi:hypothetical protein
MVAFWSEEVKSEESGAGGCAESPTILCHALWSALPPLDEPYPPIGVFAGCFARAVSNPVWDILPRRRIGGHTQL